MGGSERNVAEIILWTVERVKRKDDVEYEESSNYKERKVGVGIEVEKRAQGKATIPYSEQGVKADVSDSVVHTTS